MRCSCKFVPIPEKENSDTTSIRELDLGFFSFFLICYDLAVSVSGNGAQSDMTSRFIRLDEEDTWRNSFLSDPIPCRTLGLPEVPPFGWEILIPRTAGTVMMRKPPSTP